MLGGLGLGSSDCSVFGVSRGFGFVVMLVGDSSAFMMLRLGLGCCLGWVFWVSWYRCEVWLWVVLCFGM